MSAAPANRIEERLATVARVHGTPAYAYDLERLRLRLEEIRRTLPEAVEVYYSLKANPAQVLCRPIAEHGLGAEVVSAGELDAALTAGFRRDRILVGGPYKPPAVLSRLSDLPQVLVSVDSVDELERLAAQGLRHRLLLRLRPDFEAQAAVPTARGSRFGIPVSALGRCRSVIERERPSVVGFHVYFGSQILDGSRLVRYLRASLDLCLRAADVLRVETRLLNLGGGFGVPYGAGDSAPDLYSVATALARFAERAAPARLILELGRYLVAEAGWYLTSVVGSQTRDDLPVAVVDGGVHHRGDLCGLDLRRRGLAPLVLGKADSPRRVTDVVGCLCLPNDVLAEGCSLPIMVPGDILAFPNAGAYGLTASPILFLGHPTPAEAVFDDSTSRSVDSRRGDASARQTRLGRPRSLAAVAHDPTTPGAVP